ncbi:MAG: hypothetical protein JXR88_04940 [Clostridia bacterium]|nr:hypothetical protein [Clostridia bacterium]
MEQFIKNWVKEMIDFQGEPTALKKCGYNCATSSGMIDEIEKKLEVTPYEGKDFQALEDYMRKHVFHEHHMSLEDDRIHLTYAFDACVCPVMNHHQRLILD